MKYLGKLIGRFFLIGDFDDIKKWSGIEENENGKSDYDLIDEEQDYIETNLIKISKDNSLNYLLHCSLSSSLELFEFNDGIIICDGLYFNENIKNPSALFFSVTNETNTILEIKNNSIAIIDASVNFDGIETVSKSIDSLEGYAYISLNNGKYIAKDVEANYIVDTEDIIFKGIYFERVVV